MLQEIINKINSLFTKKTHGAIVPNQRVGIKIESMPHTFITRIEDVDKDNIYISAISDKEMNFALPLPNQQMELFIFMDEFYYKNKCVLKKKVTHPVPMWVLSKPDKLIAFSERRGTFRMENVLDATFKVSSGLIKDVKHGLTKNISIGGIAMVSTADLPLKTMIDVTVSGMGEGPLTVTAEIVWKYSRPDFDKWFYGVRFLEVDDKKQAQLNKHINERLRSLRWAGLV
jgi:c-di-GMP-binding flagellar brake protein YcgR